MKSIVRQEQVKELVNQFPHIVENSSLLVSYYWKYINGATTLNEAAHCSSPESITRAFRRLVRKGEIVLTQEERDKREQYQEEFRLDYSPV